MTRRCKCFGCEEIKDDCEKVDISQISRKDNIRYYCFECFFELGLND